MADIQTVASLYAVGQNQIQTQDPTLTDFNPGSILDILTGVMATMFAEAQAVTVTQFAKTFVETANGPEVTGGPDDLQRLLVDHFGVLFARPSATFATGTITFNRASTANGTVYIQAGTIVKMAPDSSGNVQRYQTTADCYLTGLTVSVAATAIVAQAASNCAILNVINIIETTLTDSTVTCVNSTTFGGGADALNDADYRAFARNLFTSLRGNTLAAIAAKALTIPGVVQAIPFEQIQLVAQTDGVGNITGAPFQISRNYLYLADVNGTASAALQAAVNAAVIQLRGSGIQLTIVPALAVTQPITYTTVLNQAGPNFANLSASLFVINNSIIAFIQALAIGAGLNRSALVTAIMATYGPGGSNDLVSFTILNPTADVAIASNQTLIPGTIASV